MTVLALVDSLYATFVATLPVALRSAADDLPFRIGLTRVRGRRWSQVFAHDVTLGAPVLVADAMAVAPSLLRDAVLVHLFSVIDAFVTDRVLDRQAPPDALVDAVVAYARIARDAAASRVGCAAGELADAHRTMRAAMRKEQEILTSGVAVTVAEYVEIARAKQAPGVPASVALARCAGWSPARVRTVGRTIEAIALALQLYDDVVDWEDDRARGGAWALALARGDQGEAPASRDRLTLAAVERQEVHASGVLAALIWRSRRQFRAASRLAAVIGATRLAGWSAARAAKLVPLAEAEEAHAGYAVRAHALSPWAMEVLA